MRKATARTSSSATSTLRRRIRRRPRLPLVEAQGDKAEIALALDEQQDRLPSRFLGFVDLAADLAGALHLLLRGLHDHVAGAHTLGGGGAVLGDLDHDHPFCILAERVLLFELRRDRRQCKAECLDNGALVPGASFWLLLCARLL